MMIKWISCKDRLPEPNKSVLTYESRYGHVSVGVFTGEFELYPDEGQEQSNDDGPQWSLSSGDDSFVPHYPIDFWAEFNYPNTKSQF